MMEMEIHKSLAEEVVDELIYRLRKEAEKPEPTICKLPEEELWEDDVRNPLSYGMKELRKRFGTSAERGLFVNRD